MAERTLGFIVTHSEFGAMRWSRTDGRLVSLAGPRASATVFESVGDANCARNISCEHYGTTFARETSLVRISEPVVLMRYEKDGAVLVLNQPAAPEAQ